MVENIIRLYPQYQHSDRRQENVPVAFERRSNVDRRKSDRLYLEPKLSKELKELYKPFLKDQTHDTFKRSFSAELKNNPFLSAALSSVPLAKRITTIENSKEEENKVKKCGLTIIALANTAEDIRDVCAIMGGMTSSAPKEYYSKYKFFAGTPFEYLFRLLGINKSVENIDKTFADSFLGRKLLKKLNVKQEYEKFPKEFKFPGGYKQTVIRDYAMFGFTKNMSKFKSITAKFIGISLNRITSIGLAVAFALEIPEIYKSIKKNKDAKQIIRSSVNVIVPAACGAMMSAAFSLLGTATHLTAISHAGTILGFGFGMYIGKKLAGKIKQGLT